MFGDTIMLPPSCGISTPEALALACVPTLPVPEACSSSVSIASTVTGGGGLGTGGVGGWP